MATSTDRSYGATAPQGQMLSRRSFAPPPPKPTWKPSALDPAHFGHCGGGGGAVTDSFMPGEAVSRFKATLSQMRAEAAEDWNLDKDIGLRPAG